MRRLKLIKLFALIKLLAAHYPVWSVKGPNQCLVNKFRPLFHKYKDNSYFNFDHKIQHIQENYLNHTIDYYTSVTTI